MAVPVTTLCRSVTVLPFLSVHVLMMSKLSPEPLIISPAGTCVQPFNVKLMGERNRLACADADGIIIIDRIAGAIASSVCIFMMLSLRKCPVVSRVPQGGWGVPKKP